MLVTYAPAGERKRQWEFDPGKTPIGVAKVIQKVASENNAGDTFDQWHQLAAQGDADAGQVLLWHLLSADHGGLLRFEDTPDYLMGELKIQRTKAEIAIMIDNAEKVTTVGQAQKAQALSALRVELERAPEGLPKEEPAPADLLTYESPEDAI